MSEKPKVVVTQVDEATYRKLAEKLTRSFVDQGKLIEAGWVGLAASSMPANAPEIQRREMRRAFFAGAQHLYSSIMVMVEPEKEPTERDMKRMSLIRDELEEFVKELRRGMN